ncbi:hypothetical protein BGW41_006672 [Actinomortierella wolfii]|nr:hypothetical protein BGW41_006672 [Actinomortierella wolfii]
MAPRKRFTQNQPEGGFTKDTSTKDVSPPFVIPQTSSPAFPPPSLPQRAQLKGIPYRPSDISFIFRAFMFIGWSLLRLHVIELPYLIVTRFKEPTRQHHPSWFWAFSIAMAISRSVAVQARTISNIRLVGEIMMAFLPLTMILRRNTKVTKVSFRVKRDVLLQPERATLSHVRQKLAKQFPDGKLDPTNPPDVYFDSFHPPSTGSNAQLANLPEEVGHIDDDGTYTLHGEWIEILDDPNNPRPRSNVVCLYFHGGGHVFLGPSSHRSWVARMMQKFGPGARAFVLDYRQAPEHPFPAAIHDAFASYLYLTEPNHEALILNEDSGQHKLGVDPRNIFVAGDSAGGNLTVAFNLYMKNYVQPSTNPKIEMPFASVAISPWTDMGSTLPAMNATDWHCFCPGPIGSSPFDMNAFTEYKTINKHFPINLARNYLCGKADLVPNQRNGFGDEQTWKWYTALAQHPLASFAHRGNLEGMPDSLFHTASYDRLVDDTRLLAHRVGLANPDKIVRLELYKDSVHVHHMLEHLDLTEHATNNIARFILRVIHARKERENLLKTMAGGIDTPISSQEKMPHPAPSPSSSNRKIDSATQENSNGSMVGDENTENPKKAYTIHTQPSEQPLSLAPLLMPSMMKDKGDDNVEWVVVNQRGEESARNEGWPITVLKNCWPLESFS